MCTNLVSKRKRSIVITEPLFEKTIDFNLTTSTRRKSVVLIEPSFERLTLFEIENKRNESEAYAQFCLKTKNSSLNLFKEKVFSKQQILELEYIFNFFDTNKDGKLNTNDLILITNDINNYEKKDDLITEISNFN